MVAEAYNQGMPENSTRVWEITPERGREELHLADMSSLDAITRQLPQGFYSTFRTFDGGRRVLGLRAHLQRLYQPAYSQQITPVVTTEGLRRHLAEMLRAYPEDAKLRVIIIDNGKIYIIIQNHNKLPIHIYKHGVKVITTDVRRQNPRTKSTTFISASESTRLQIADSQYFEALLLRNDRILEGMTSNFFYVKEGELGTARGGILLGVTRRTVLRVARGSGLSILYRPLKRGQVPALTEAFLTSSSRGIVPIVQIDDMPVGEGRPGKITRGLQSAYDRYVRSHAETVDP